MKLANQQPLRMMRTRKASKSERGFTMIETMVSLVVMLIVALGAASLFVYATRNNSGAADRAAAVAIAQQRMERLRSVTFDDASLNAGTTNVTVTSSGRRFRVQTTICNTAACGGSATLKVVTIQVTPTSAGALWARNTISITSLRATSTIGAFAQ